MKIKKTFLLLFFACLLSKLIAQNEEHPKLVIGVVVDQMRYDYLVRFYNDFGADGFKKLLEKGFNCKTVNYNYKPTYTGPGHASIFTGVTPSVHGIIGNNWYSYQEKQNVYCVQLEENGEKTYNPTRMLSETFADGMKQYFSFESKSYGVSLKDRGAILPAGHLADGAYWFDSRAGKWVSSDFYEDKNAVWLNDFNRKDFEKEYLKNGWSLSLPIENYTESEPDKNNFEINLSDKSNSFFPYNLVEIKKEIGWDLVKRVPQGNRMTADLAKAIIKNEALGKRNVTDFISVSFSATDYVGHRFGVQSVEVQDTYIKLDKTLADLIQFLDQQIGEDEYLFFLTSDHGAGMPRSYLKEKGLPNGEINIKELTKSLKEELNLTFNNKDWLVKMINLNLYFNEKLKTEQPEEFVKVKKMVTNRLLKHEGIMQVVDVGSQFTASQDGIEKIHNGVYVQRSGDLIILEKPNWSTYYDKGSTHGSSYAYDTHVPLLFYGKNVKQGSTAKAHPITAIVPTLVELTGIPFENSSTEKAITEAVK